MSNSSLVIHTNLSPCYTAPRKDKIDTITIHCVVGQCTAESLGELFSKKSRQVSSNYGVDKDGRIGLYVEEENRSWCTSSAENDNRAITIEVASDTVEPYKVTDSALKSLIELCADICKRNNISELRWKADKALIGKPNEQNMTVHRWFANKACPGEYLYERHGYIAEEVNKLLNAKEKPPVVKPVVDVKEPDQTPPKTIVEEPKELPDTKTVKTEVNIPPSEPAKVVTPKFKEYLVKIAVSAINIRKGPGMNFDVAQTLRHDKNTYTIVEEATGAGASKWGKLKSGAGWLSLDYVVKV